MNPSKICLLLSVIIMAVPVQAQDIDLRYKVSVNINADDLFEARLYRGISREFRQTPHIKLVDYDDAEYEVTVLCIQATSKANVINGYVASLTVTYLPGLDKLITAMADISMMRNADAAEDSMYSTVWRTIGVIAKKAVAIQYQLLLIDPDLENLAGRIAAETDYNVFEPLRKSENLGNNH